MFTRDTIRQMKEVLSEQNEERNPRPIGRFLLGLETYDEVRNSFSYAREFALKPGNFPKYKHKSVKVPETRPHMVDGRNVQLEFSINRYDYAWKIIVFAEQRKTEHISTNYSSHGGEQYELHCSEAKSEGYYREYNGQGMIIRERAFGSAEELAMLQGLIEYMLNTADEQD